MHANIFEGLVSRADVIAGYRTYPHVDHLPTAERAGRTLVRAMRGEVKPVIAWGNAPMLPHVMAQGSYRSPNKDLQAMAEAMEHDGEALVASVFTGFPHADVSQAGLSAVVVTDNDPAAAAERLVARLLDAAWAERQTFTFQTEPLTESVARAKTLEGPVVLLDHCDNSSSGGTMDTTTVLAEIMRQGLEDVVFFGIYDPDAVQAAMRAGVGATVEDFGSAGAWKCRRSPEATNHCSCEGARAHVIGGIFRQRQPDAPRRRGIDGADGGAGYRQSRDCADQPPRRAK